jgi:hypothetical protein
MGLINAEKSIFDDKAEEVFKMVPRLNLCGVDGPHKVLFTLLRWNHEHMQIIIAL